MRKAILILFVLACQLPVAAQRTGEPAGQGFLQERLLLGAHNGVLAVPVMHKSSRATGAGVSYAMPQGAFYGGFGPDGSGGLNTELIVQPWHPLVFAQQDADKMGTWHVWAPDDEDGWVDVIDRHPLSVVDGDGNYTWTQTPNGHWWTPTLTLDGDSFALGSENYYTFRDKKTYPGLILSRGVGAMKAYDDRQCYRSEGRIYRNLARYGIVGDNVYGTGVVELGSSYVSWGAAQPMPRPMAPLYVEEVFVEASSYSRQPIAEGDTLFCYVSKGARGTNAVRMECIMPTYEYTDTLYALPGDTIGFVETELRGSGDDGKTIYLGKIVFRKWVKDEEGQERAVPFVIDPADFDENGFVLVVDGFHHKGVDVGVDAAYLNPDYDGAEIAQILIFNPDTGASYPLSYGVPIGMRIGLMAMYDAVRVPEDVAPFMVASDGQGKSDGVEVFTAMPWFDADGLAAYTLEGLPEWVTAVHVDESRRDVPDEEGVNLLSFECELLPEGLDEREAKVFVCGKGVVGDVPIVIHQDNADGISDVVASPDTERSYDLGGRVVSRGTKGVVVCKGRKKVSH